MALTQVIHLTQETYGLPPVVHMVQGDTGRRLMMVIDDVELSGNPTATLYWIRSDLSHYSNNAEYDSQNNAFIADVSQALTQPSNTQCQLKVMDDNNLVVSTYTFIINVQMDVDGIQESQLGYSATQLQMMISAAYSGRFSDDAKEALLNLLEHVAYTDEHGQDYLDDLAAALYPPKTLIGISAVYTQTGTIYDNDTLDDLEADLVVTGHYDDLSTETIPATDYTLTGSLTTGTSVITVTCDEFTTTFNVTVTHMPGTVTITNTLTGCTSSNAAASATEGDSYSATITASSMYTLTGATVSITMGGVDITAEAYDSGTISIDELTGNLSITITAVAVTLSSISAVYTQSGTVYTTDSLDSLKTDLVVTATWSDTSTSTVAAADYTLSGTLTVGTSTVTVSYGGKTTTFTVTVTAGYITTDLVHQWDAIKNTESGHNSSATKWEDLVGSNDLTINGASIEWGDDYISFAGTTGHYLISDSDITLTGGRTVEVVFEPGQSATMAVVTPFCNGGVDSSTDNAYGKIIVYSDNTVAGKGINGNTYPTGLTGLTDIKSIAVSLSDSTTVSALYVNGSKKSTGSTSHSLRGAKTKMVVGASPTTYDYAFKGKIHAIRIYNSVLSDADVAANYLVDVSRFGL